MNLLISANGFDEVSQFAEMSQLEEDGMARLPAMPCLSSYKSTGAYMTVCEPLSLKSAPKGNFRLQTRAL